MSRRHGSMAAIAVLAGAAVAAGCQGSAASGGVDGGAPVCSRLAETDAYACAEAQFWTAFRAPGLPARQAAEDQLEAVLAQFPSPKDDAGASLMHFRLGQVRLAMALENAQQTYVLNAGEDIIAPFDTAMALDTYGGIIAPWKDAMQIASAAALQDWTDAVPLAQAGFQSIPLNPMGNTLSLSGTTIGFPLSTNVPQTTISYLDDWQCSGVAWCTANTAHAPFARPGLGYHFAEAYARVGDRAKAAAYLDQAASAPDYDVWPYKKSPRRRGTTWTPSWRSSPCWDRTDRRSPSRMPINRMGASSVTPRGQPAEGTGG